MKSSAIASYALLYIQTYIFLSVFWYWCYIILQYLTVVFTLKKIKIFILNRQYVTDIDFKCNRLRNPSNVCDFRCFFLIFLKKRIRKQNLMIAITAQLLIYLLPRDFFHIANLLCIRDCSASHRRLVFYFCTFRHLNYPFSFYLQIVPGRYLIYCTSVPVVVKRRDNNFHMNSFEWN